MPDSLPIPTADPAPRSRARVRYNATLKLVRRAHLYVGLFMTPWVFLYGITGFLFNHPEAFPDREVHTIPRSEIAGTALEGFPTASELAVVLVETLNEGKKSPAFHLVDERSATYSRTIFVTATGRDREHNVRFDPESGESFIRSSKLTKRTSSTWPGGTSLALADPPRERLVKGVPALLTKLGIEADTVTVRNPPNLICSIEHEGRRWRVTYDIETGATSARPAGESVGRLSNRRFLTGLHLAFTYPSRVDARWFWAIAVDAMFVAMVFWGGSGILMWWQMKKLRRWGFLTLIVSGIVATAIAYGMHEVLVSRI